MKSSTISIYVQGKLVLKAENLVYDEEAGRAMQLFPPAIKFSGSVGKVMTLGAAGEVTEAAEAGLNKLVIVAEIL